MTNGLQEEDVESEQTMLPENTEMEQEELPQDIVDIPEDNENIVREESPEELPENEEVEMPELSYRVHVQSYGWQSYMKNGEMAGTTGKAKRLEAIELRINNSPYEGGIEYCTHVQSYGWQDWVANGIVSGTSGKAKRLEAIRIRLTGELSEHYDIYYRVHAQSYGWLGWAKNGEKSGTASYAKRLEGIEVVLVEKNAEAPGETQGTYYSPRIQYRTHVQSYGWQGIKADGATSGTSGKAKRLEAIRINLYDKEDLGYDGSIEYCTHVQSYGWQNWVSDGAVSGTTGKAKRLEAIRIRLTGELAEHYSVYYRVHCQTLGWLSWAKDGAPAGTEGFSKRLEAIEIRLISKESSDVPNESGQAFVSQIADSDITLFGRVWQEEKEGICEGQEISVQGNGQT